MPSSTYRRRRPEQTVLYETLRRHYRSFIANAEASGRELPPFIRREFEKFLRCGILAHGFVRVHCGGCGFDRLVAYSCKARGFCPSCIGRRMADTAAHLTDAVLPDVPTRTWTLTFPPPLRYLLAYNTSVLSDVLRAYSKALFDWQRRRVAELLGGIDRRRMHPGMVTWIQRFGSAANLNVHLHSVVFDGVFIETDEGGTQWRGLPEPSKGEVAAIAWDICMGVSRALKRRGLSLAGEDGDIDELSEREPLLAACYAAALRGFVATGHRAGRRVKQLGVAVEQEDARPNFFAHGFNLYAGRRIAATDVRRREHAIRYMARPPIPEGALSLAPDGEVVLRLKRAWSNGVTHLKMSGEELVERLVSLIPRPRSHLVRYHGVLAPNARLRASVVQQTSAPTPKRCGRHLDWAELTMRVFEFEVRRCPRCGAEGMQSIATIDEPDVIRRILKHVGESAAPPQFRPASRTAEFYDVVA